MLVSLHYLNNIDSKILRRIINITLAATWLSISIPAVSATLSFSFTDPAGDFSTFPDESDFSSITDIVGVTITFETETGDFHAQLTATNDRPFLGTFEPNFQYFNADADPFTEDPAIVRDWLFGDNRFTLSAPSNTFTFSGNNPNYMNWKAGDRVATSIGFPDSPFAGPLDWPTNQGFASNFYIFGAFGTASDILAIDSIAVISTVPIPASFWLVSSAMLVITRWSRRRI